MPIMEISVVPLGTSSVSVSETVKKALKGLKDEPDMEYTLTAMGTIIRADSVNRLLVAAEKMHAAALQDAQRVNTSIKIDDRKDKPLSIRGKVASVYADKKTAPDANEWLQTHVTDFLCRLGVAAGMKIIDFGCRVGRYAIPAVGIVGRKGRVFAVDKDYYWLEKLGTSVPENERHVIDVLGLSEWKERIESDSLDMGILFDVFHPGYFPAREQRAKFLQELMDRLKPGARLQVLPTHIEQFGMSESDLLEEFRVHGFYLHKRHTEDMVHDYNLERLEILEFNT